jgi:hypothetical protein
MKNLPLIVCLVALSSSAFGYQERIERDGDQVKASWTSPDGVTAAGRESAGFAPTAGNFFVFTGAFPSKDLTCDQFLAKVHGLLSDWNKYPHTSFFAMMNCSNGRPGQKSSTDFIYGLDAWRPDAVAEVQAFLRDHRGLAFEGQTLWFSAVNKLDVKTTLALGVLGSNGGFKPFHSADAWSEFPSTEQWFPTNAARAKLVAQTDLDVFLDWVGKTYGNDEKAPFQEALASSSFVQFSDFFTVHLENGGKAVFWLGFGGSRRCGTKPCFAKAPPSDE